MGLGVGVRRISDAGSISLFAANPTTSLQTLLLRCRIALSGG